MKFSFPKNKIKVLLLEGIHPDAAEKLRAEGYPVELISGSLEENELAEKIKDVFILGIRSRTKITKKVLENAQRLLAIGAFCIGTNQIDLKATAQKGIAVFNAPYSNTRSVVELAIGEMIMLMRRTFDMSRQLHEGKWNKSAKNSFEIRGKTLGIIGYGNIGQQLSVVAESLGMQVYYYDVNEKLAMGNAQSCTSLAQLLQVSDVVSIHVDGREENANMFSTKEFDAMKGRSYLLNLSRGSVVDLEALKQNMESGKIAGASIDVYPKEPKQKQADYTTCLQNMANVILTPHVGGSTEEAQRNIADFVPKHIIQYVNTGNSSLSVNLPQISLTQQKDSHRMLHIHHNVPGVMAKINTIFAKYDLNIVGQYLKTNEQIGYLITDVNKNYDVEVINELKELQDTIKLRVLY
ncbi:phosphoglycerate dehydrogenase [Candidatus Uabimicrobium amorphum]|uniref:D-3-phosphoglycerate dehydrogenase n=1 Tax=Uabimicrobium amorphum TaxID=2596890 RepID=A0A5S9F2V2_UABAM|nr:phosphoglycerate dehydrogenase [Candidatus Uabimicrobium amorphum]BBM83828.1 D-3-phosphoglycerate dehydrogenase [Candidatus Uabimicrobium amorphum]